MQNVGFVTNITIHGMVISSKIRKITLRALLVVMLKGGNDFRTDFRLRITPVAGRLYD